MCGRYKLTVPFREIVRLYNVTNGVNLPATDRIVPPLSAKALADVLPKATAMTPPLGQIGLVAAHNAPTIVWRHLSDCVGKGQQKC